MSTRGKFLYYDGDLCMGCHSCEVACKVEHELPVGVNRVYILVEGPIVVNGELRLSFKRVACIHCPKPSCIKICPNRAIKKRPDGIMRVDPFLCTGCQDCAKTCPYGAISFHPQKYWAEICDLCAERRDQGLPPFCVQHCMSGALFFGTKEKFQQQKRKIVFGGRRDE